MGKLAGARTYLAGAMDRAVDHGDGWRDRITPMLQRMGVIVADPRHKPIDIGMEDAERRELRHKNKAAGNWEAVEADRDIRHVDLRLVDTCDFTIVHLDMTQKPCGTMDELFTGDRQKKPILIWCEDGKANCPDWLFWLGGGHKYIFSTLDEVLEYLQKVDRGEVQDKRWVLFDWDKLIRETEAVYGPL